MEEQQSDERLTNVFKNKSPNISFQQIRRPLLPKISRRKVAIEVNDKMLVDAGKNFVEDPHTLTMMNKSIWHTLKGMEID